MLLPGPLRHTPEGVQSSSQKGSQVNSALKVSKVVGPGGWQPLLKEIAQELALNNDPQLRLK
jgi:hypothetical protein